MTVTYFATKDRSAEQNKAYFIAVLNNRASNISDDLEYIISNIEPMSNTGQSIDSLQHALIRFRDLQKQHIDAVRMGNDYLAHEIAGQINVLLSTVREQLDSLNESDLRRRPFRGEYDSPPPGPWEVVKYLRESLRGPDPGPAPDNFHIDSGRP